MTSAGGCSVNIPAVSDPHLDPVPGGYTYEYGPLAPGPNIRTATPDFANANPYYYSLSDLPTGSAIGACGGIPISTDSTLSFFDAPSNLSCTASTPCFTIVTQLVGVCEAITPTCPSLGPSAPLWQLTWQTNYNGSTGGVFQATTANVDLPDPGSGTGGVTITSINGVQLPPVVPTNQIATTASDLAYNPVSQTSSGTVTVTNTTGSPISGPLQIVFFGLPANVTLVNATGSLSGTPYLSVPGVLSLGPGQSVTVSVQFANPSNAAITFTAVIYSGSINTVFGRCDLQYNGSTNVADVQLVVNEALGAAAAVSDLSGDGVLNVVDVQIVIDAALGLGCSGS